MVSDIKKAVEDAYGALSEGRLDVAHRMLLDVIPSNDAQELHDALKGIEFWKSREQGCDQLGPGYGKGEYLLGQWKKFLAFMKAGTDLETPLGHAFRSYVFGAVLESLSDSRGLADPDVFVRMGKSYKALGNYEMALEHFENANTLRKEHSDILANMGDCFAFLGETGKAKLFFREAFFINPQAIDLAFLESAMIGRLIQKSADMGYGGEGVEEWLPVVGVLFGVFNVKRELRPVELGKLKHTIYSMEVELRSERNQGPYLVPRLLNRYFWLIDHYVWTKEDKSRIDEVLVKIRSVDPTVFEHFVS